MTISILVKLKLPTPKRLTTSQVAEEGPERPPPEDIRNYESSRWAFMRKRGITIGRPGKSNATLRYLFDAPKATAQNRVGWFRIELAQSGALGARSGHPWDIAHLVVTRKLDLKGVEILAAEPDLEQQWLWRDSLADFSATSQRVRASQRRQTAERVKEDSVFGWHLEKDYTDLLGAQKLVDNAKSITIAHLDTDIDFFQKAKPRNLSHKKARSFIRDAFRPSHIATAVDSMVKAGHGTGTIGILAGGKIGKDGKSKRLRQTGARRSAVANQDKSKDDLDIGASPESYIVPLSVANPDGVFWTSSIAQGIDYATRIGARVISLSLGGVPSWAWADVVNAAYDAGIVVVCAAGNNARGIPTSLLLYPARFQRVIAACGATRKGKPYSSLGRTIEGNAGPASRMTSAMASYSTDIPWLVSGQQKVTFDGAGTDAATPQIAAAAALWLARHDTNERGPACVEAVRFALFESAKKTHSISPDRYFGRGILRAESALGIVSPTELMATPEDEAWFGFLPKLLRGLADPELNPCVLRMLCLEMTQLALNSRAAREAIPDPDRPDKDIPIRQKRRFLEAIAEERTASISLRTFLQEAFEYRSEQRYSTIHEQREDGAPPPSSGAEIRRRVPLVPKPTTRRLRVFATDPGDSDKMQSAFTNVATVSVPWERLRRGPTGEYLEVIDIDPASNLAYSPVDLDDRHLLAQDGHAPSEGHPQFHQQMVYAVAMRTIRNFEIALGRRILWSERRPSKESDATFSPAPGGGYVQRLRIYPHALREHNAYYSPDKKALLFGYFAYGKPPNEKTVFTCLSHDIITHETTHAVLDGLHRRYQEDTNPDVLAFHEAFADIVAIFQHFTFPELLRFEIARLRGRLDGESALSDLARQFGNALHNKRALRRAIGSEAHPDRYRTERDPHGRGAILVAAVFDAFLTTYVRRTRDLLRLATGGSGVLAAGAIHPDLVDRLAKSAVEVAQRVLTLCIRALDYMPPVDPSFGDYLRAIVTADADSAPEEESGYRVAFAEAFNKRGIYPVGIANVSPDSLLWHSPEGPVQSARLGDFLRSLDLSAYTQSDRRNAFASAKQNAARFHNWLEANIDEEMGDALGLDFRTKNCGERLPFEVHSMRPAHRVTSEGEHRLDVVAVLTQKRMERLRPNSRDKTKFTYRGGCTLLLDREYDSDPIRYAIAKPVWATERLRRIRQYRSEKLSSSDSLAAMTYEDAIENFSELHAGLT